ncbi:MAG: hypothetical protein ACPGED_00610, partial [Flavobacteriales bacterium]
MKTFYTISRTLFALLVIMISSIAVSAQYYWVNGTGEWSDYANHWATTSGGGSYHASAPSEFDDVYFDANS